MKKLIALSFLLTSPLAWANPVPQNEAQEIYRAIQDSLTVAPLWCRMSERANTVNASELNWKLLMNSGEMSIYEGDQLITIKAPLGEGELIFEIRTSTDLTKVVNIKSEQYKFETAVVNVGTIIRPRYEERTVKKVTHAFECK